MKADIWTDGACCHKTGITSYGYIIICETHRVIKRGRVIGPGTNNTAEMTAIIKAVKMSLDIGIDEIFVHSDSTLALGLIFGKMKTSHLHLINLQLTAQSLKSKFKSVSYEHCPREQGFIPDCDKLANNALKSQPWAISEPLEANYLDVAYHNTLN